MGAILGWVSFDGGTPDVGILDRMANSLSHRGATRAGPLRLPGVGLDARHAAAGRPRAALHREGSLLIAADARIDNEPELRDELDLEPVESPGAQSAAALLATAYRRWGDALASHLKGDYAVLLYDGERPAILAFRDRMGVRPLYYSERAGRLVFATETRALFATPGGSRSLDERRVADYLTGMLEDREITFYEGVRRLPAGQTLVMTRSSRSRTRHAVFDGSAVLRLDSDRDYEQAFRSALDLAVRRRVDPGGTTGSFLSGGLDSSSIAVLAARECDRRGSAPLRVYSGVFPGLPEEDRRKVDESSFIEAVLEGEAMAGHRVAADRLSPFDDIDRVLWHAEEAVPAPNLFLHWAIYRIASDQGVRVMLDGIDGDTTVSHGTATLAELAGRGRLFSLWREARSLVERSPRAGLRSLDLAWRLGLRPWVPDMLRRIWRGVRRENGRWQPPDDLIQERFLQRIDYRARLQAFDTDERLHRSARQEHLDVMSSPLYQQLLEGTDRAAGAFGIDPAYPFFDDDLMDLCLALPADQKLRDGWTRSILRRATGGVLPEPVRWRTTKGNLGINFRRQLFERGASEVERALVLEPGPLARYLDLPRVEETVRAWLDGSRPGLGLRLFCLAVLGRWLSGWEAGETRESDFPE